MKPRARLLLALLTGVMLGVLMSFGGGVMAGKGGSAFVAEGVREVSPLPWEDARLLAEVMQRVRENYVDRTDDHKLLKDAMRGLVAGLDEHSAFLDRDEFAELKVSTTGSYAGVGLEVEAVEAGVRIARCLPDSPAARSGLRAGDLITAIDGETPVAADIDAVVVRLRGAVGSTVQLTVRRPSTEANIDVVLERAEVELRSVHAEILAPGFGYLRIESFSDTTDLEVEQALAQLLDGASLSGLLIDLRDNPGGVLEAAVRVADDLLDHGTIVTADGRSQGARFRMEAEPGDLAGGIPLAVLVNGGTASAAEILAAALHDNGRAVLIGRKTYGKGSVQTILPLTDGEAIKLTTSRYQTPRGVWLNGVGITPDTVLAGEEAPRVEPDPEGMPSTLARRDGDVAIALQTLRTRERLVARRATVPRS